MATPAQCRKAVKELTDKYHAVDAEARKKNIPDRTIELVLLDLDLRFRGHVRDGQLCDIVEEDAGTLQPKPNVRVVTSSDDFIEMTEGRLKFAHAWAKGRVRLDASMRDLLRLRSVL